MPALIAYSDSSVLEHYTMHDKVYVNASGTQITLVSLIISQPVLVSFNYLFVMLSLSHYCSFVVMYKASYATVDWLNSHYIYVLLVSVTG